jgi:hypothetical protein
MKTCPLIISALFALPLAAAANEPPAQDASQNRGGAVEGPVPDETIEVHFQRLDNDEDGALTLEEIPSDYILYRDFARWDANKDGVINLYEFDGYVDQLAQL